MHIYFPTQKTVTLLYFIYTHTDAYCCITFTLDIDVKYLEKFDMVRNTTTPPFQETFYYVLLNNTMVIKAQK